MFGQEDHDKPLSFFKLESVMLGTVLSADKSGALMS